MNQNQKKLCIYHKNCLDGFASAFILGKFFGFDAVEFMAREYHDPIPDITGRDVYVVDFSYKPEVLLPVLATAKSVVMLDHHDGAATDWGLNWANPPQIALAAGHTNFVQVIDVEKSGVGVVWDFFYNSEPEQPYNELPFLLQIVQDYDLYKFNFLNTRQIQAALISTRMIVDQDFEAFQNHIDAFDDFGNTDQTRLIEQGNVVLEAQEVWCRQFVERTQGTILMGGYQVPIANVPYDLRNIAGEMMYDDVPFSVTYEDRLGEGIRKFSLRSRRDTGLNVIEIVKPFGGSGHPHAAGFTLPLTQKPSNEATITDLLNF